MSYTEQRDLRATRLDDRARVGTRLPLSPEDPPSPHGTPVWLELGSEPLYAVLHEPTDLTRRDTAVLLLPVFGLDEAFSYRARRDWAIALAQSGFTTARIDLPGTEDSAGSPLDSGRVASWVEAVSDVVHWLREASGSSRVAVIGIGLGGLLAIEATRSGAPIDDLVLWAVPASGKACLRALRIYSKTIMRAAHASADPDRPDGAMGLAGYVMSAETAAAISRIDIEDLSLPPDRAHHALLIGRDAHGIDERLRQHLGDAGATVTAATSSDYGQMMTFADKSKAPRGSIERSIAWLSERAAPTDESVSPMDSDFVSDVVSFDYDGCTITERQVRLDSPSGRLVGILSEPEGGDRAPFCIVSVDGGTLRRTSPSRMWTELCRRSAARGIPALRFDFDGIGDSEGQYILRVDRTPLDEHRITSDQLRFHDYLERHGIADSFVTVGFCAGADREFRIALEDDRVVGSILINPVSVEWTAAQARDRLRRHALEPLRGGLVNRVRAKRMPSLGGLARTSRALVETALGAGAAAARSQLTPVTDAFDTFAQTDTSALFLFSQNEPLHDQLRRLGVLASLEKWPNLQVEQLPTSDHHLRPLTVQQLVQARIDEFLTDLRNHRSTRALRCRAVARAG
jgi:dienelactone hydrolase